MEYGSLAWIGAAVSHLEKLDSVQEAAMKIGRFKVESLASRRDAAAAAFACKLLDGKGRDVLKLHVPKVLHLPAPRGRSKLSDIQMVNRVDAHSLANTFDRSFIGSMHGLWAKLPDEIKTFGDARGWLKVRELIK